MNDDLIAQIQTFTLNARAILETEAGQQLEGIYGWLPEGPFGDVKAYPAISQFEEARETRRRLEQFAEDEKTAGLSSADAREKLVRETAFTWLNRFAAFRLMEERKLLKPTIVKLEKSNGFIYWITKDANKGAYELHQQGGLPINPMGEGPIDVAYRRFLLWQCGELARDVAVLFDPDILVSRLCPRPPVLKQLVDEMTAETVAAAWQPGNDETIGWIYEGFIEDENKAVFDKFSKGKKVEAEEIGAATQRFTPRWIVRFLVENSLGRLWMEMHPDSRLATRLKYLVPAEKSESRPLKQARNISFLDPCCGSMHFGLVAFDVLLEMYLEELERKGQSGWPADASVESADEIRGSIIAHNLHGIDLDLRAVQIAAVALFLKARTGEPQATFTDLNLACANVEEISAGRLESLIAQAKFSHPVHERILRNLVSQMKESEQLGSLLRLERVLENLIAEERKKAEAQKQLKLSIPGASSEQFKSQEGIEEFFGKLSEQILQELDYFVRASRSEGSDPGYIVNEAAKGLRYLRLVSRHYDVVATNPPYMSRRNMSHVMANHLDEQYAQSKGDLYAAFISRCVDLAGPLGKIAMVTQQSFMFISSYEDLRGELRSSVKIGTMAHLGPKAFPNITGEKVNTTAFVFEKQSNEQLREEHIGTYFRLVKEPDADSKRRAFETAIETLGATQPDSRLFRYIQKDFDAIPGQPWVYWITGTLREVFRRCPSLGNVATVRKGLATCDNKRFVRYWWEVGTQSLRFQSKPSTHQRKWNPYVKGGGFRRWYGNQDYVVNWRDVGRELRTYVESIGQPVAAESFFFKQGITYSYLTSAAFCARKLPDDYIFDAAGSSLFTDRLEAMLGTLNSEPAFYFLRLINPTVNFQAGDLRRLPVPYRDSRELNDLVAKGIHLQESCARRKEITLDFVRPFRTSSEAKGIHDQLRVVESAVNQEIYLIYEISDADRAEIRRELAEAISQETESADEVEAFEETQTDKNAGEDDIASSWLSYAIGTVLGRFVTGMPNALGYGDFNKDVVVSIGKLTDPTGAISERDHPKDIVKRVLTCLELMLGRDDAHTTISVATGQAGDPEELLREWIDRTFWKYHLQMYRKRPLYWPLQSPRKKLTVWVFHERFTKDTLFKVRSEFVESKGRWLETRIKELKAMALAGEGRERRAGEKEASKLAEMLDDVKEFAERLNRITQGGYTPHTDDGVLLNAAPLWELLPSWPETKKAWKELEAGEYDWAQQAMEYWPKRVKEKCKTNKSFAIAHGLA